MKLAWKRSILKRITIAYVLFVFVPVLLVSLYNYFQVQQNIRIETTLEARRAVDNLDYGIVKELDLVEGVSGYLCGNLQIQNFLSTPFDIETDSYEDYQRIIAPIVNYALAFNTANIRRIRVFMQNDTIPEGYGAFFSEARLTSMPWHQAFLSSNALSGWLRVDASTYFQNNLNLVAEDEFVFVQRIRNAGGKDLGLLVLEVSQEDIFRTFQKEYGTLGGSFLFDRMGTVLYTAGLDASNAGEDIAGLFTRLDPERDILEDGSRLVVYRTDDRLALTYGIVTSLARRAKDYRSVIFLSLFTISALAFTLLAFFAVFQRIFRGIRNQIALMDQAVHGDFSMRIPVGSRNELGAIAEHFNSMLEKINAMIKENVIRQTMQKDAQLRSLQYQINPHFFYNTLDIMSGRMMMEGNAELADSIAEFGKILRYNIGNRSMTSTLGMEIEHIRSYIRIQKLRYDDNLTLDTVIPEPMKTRRILKFILQPIVENSILHGAGTAQRLHVRIEGTEDPEHRVMTIRIRDDGAGIPADRLNEINERFLADIDTETPPSSERGIGLANINDRIRLFYGSEYPLRMESEEGVYTETCITLPIGD